MSNIIQVHTFIDEAISSKLKELLCEDIELIAVASLEELSDKDLIIVSDISFTSTTAKVVYITNELSNKKIGFSPLALENGKAHVVKQLEVYLGVPQTPKERVESSFTKVKQYKVTSPFSVGYYTDLVNLKAFENSFDIEPISKCIISILNEIVLTRQCSPLEIELLIGEDELMIQFNASSLHIDETLSPILRQFSGNDLSYYSLKKNPKRGQFELKISFEKVKSYTAVFEYELVKAIQKNLETFKIDQEERIVDHSNHHENINKKVTVSTLKSIIGFLNDIQCTEDDFLDKLDTYPDKDILKILTDDELVFIKNSILNSTSAQDLENVIKTTVDKKFRDVKVEKFNEDFFNNIDRESFKKMVNPDNWPLDSEKLKEEVRENIIVSGKVEDYSEYVTTVKGYVEEKYQVDGNDFEIVKGQVESNITEKELENCGKSVESFVRDAEFVQMQQKVARMSKLFAQIKDQLEKEKMKAQNTVVKGTTEHVNDDHVTLVKGSGEASDENNTTIVKGTTEKANDDQMTIVKGSAEDLGVSQNTVIKGSAEDIGDDQKTIIKGRAEDIGDDQKTVLKGSAEDIGDNHMTVIKTSDEVIDNKVTIIKADPVVDSSTPIQNTKTIPNKVDMRKLYELEDRVGQLTKELEHKNDSIEVMSKKVDDANALSDENKHELSLMQQKYREEILKVEDLEKELEKFKSGNAESAEDLQTKLRDANIEIKMHKQRLKFAQTQVQNLEKAKKASANNKTDSKKIAHLEKLMDKQKKAKSKVDNDLAALKKDNHKISQENRMLTNKIKELERKLNNKNKNAA